MSEPPPTAAELGSAGTRILLDLDDGRQLEVFSSGPYEATALILCHGTPGCGMVSKGWSEICAERGLRLVGYSRPGYGASTRLAGRTVADAARDVAAVAHAVGAERYFVLGHSGGGSHALACAALLPGQVIATAVIASAAPRTADGLDWLAGQMEENVQEFEAAMVGGERLRALLEEWRADMLAPREAQTHSDEPASSHAPADAASVTPENAAFAAARNRHGLSTGIWGWYDDDRTEVVPWGFDPARIRGPVAIWHGGQDFYVPISHGRWLADVIPAARPHLLADEGHFSILEARLGDVVEDLKALESR